MWIQLSCWYGFIVFGVYSGVLPQSDAALQTKLGAFSMKQLKNIAEGISNDPDRKHTEFKALLKPLLIPRMPDTDNNRFVQEYIKTHFNKIGWDVESLPFEDNTPYGRKTFTNIIATHDPSVKRKMVIACHYDSKNMSDSAGNYLIAATDSAVPCAIMMDLAKKLQCGLNRKKKSQKRGPADDITIQMMFFDGEEAYKYWTDTDSTYGSRHLAQWLKDTKDMYYPDTSRLDTIDIFVLLDLIGSYDIEFKNFFAQTKGSYENLVNIEKKLKEGNLLNKAGYVRKGLQDKVLFSKATPWGRIEDDHIPFINAKHDFPVLHLISSPFPAVWHRMADNERAIDYDVTDNFNRIFRVLVCMTVGIKDVTCPK